VKDYIIRKLKQVDEQKTVTNDDFKSLYKLATEQLVEYRDDGSFVNVAYGLIGSIRKKIEGEKSSVETQNVVYASSDKEEAKKEEAKKKEYNDRGDKNQFDWGGVRSGSQLFEHPMKASPMFFRRDGMVFDSINLYQDSAVFLVCNGSSFKDVNKDSLHLPGIMTMGINNGGHVFRPNLWSCVDDPSRFMKSIWEDPTITKFVPQAHFEKRLYDKVHGYSKKLVGDCPNVIGFRRNEHFQKERWLHEHTINWGNHKDHGGGRSVMISTLKLCYLLGFKRIYIVGCDFDMSPDKKYFFEEERSKGAIKNNKNSYKIMQDFFSDLKPLFAEEGVEVFNLNPKSKLEAFDYMNYSVAIQREVIDISDSTEGMYESPKDKQKQEDKGDDGK
jgi:hypothetical protein